MSPFEQNESSGVHHFGNANGSAFKNKTNKRTTIIKRTRKLGGI